MAEFPFAQFMATIANASLLNDLESQREQGAGGSARFRWEMLPQGALRTAEVTACCQFQPFPEVGGDFLDFFTLTDGVIGIYLGDVTGKGLPAALYAALAVGTLRGVSPPYAAVRYGVSTRVREFCESPARE